MTDERTIKLGEVSMCASVHHKDSEEGKRILANRADVQRRLSEMANRLGIVLPKIK